MCDRCDYYTKHKGNLNNHQKVKHEKRSFKCLQCVFTTYFKQYLQKHMKEKHGMPVMYFCSDCGYCNVDKQEYNMHKKTEHASLKEPRNITQKHKRKRINTVPEKKQVEKDMVSLNSEELKTEVFLIEPKLENSSKQFSCDSCDYSTDRKPTLNIHKKAVHIGNLDFSCDSCPFHTTTKEYLVRHIQRGHPELDNSRPYPLVTPEKELPEHKFYTENLLPILFIEGFVLKMNKYRLNHQGQKCAYFYCNEKNKHKCKVSAKAFVEQTKKDSNDSQHENSVNDSTVEELTEVLIKEEIDCSEDDKENLKLISYQGMHTENCSKMNPEEYKPKRRVKQDEGDLKCDLCDHVATSDLKLYAHRGEKHNLTDFSCNKCDFTTHLYNKLKIHKRDEHDGRSHPCSMCDHISTSPSHLKSHIQSIHEDVTYQCEKCGQKFKQSYTLKIHIDTEHNGFLNKCKLCNYATKQSGRLNHHVRTIHLGQLHKCEECGKEYKHRHMLKEHIKNKHDPDNANIEPKIKRNRKENMNTEESMSEEDNKKEVY